MLVARSMLYCWLSGGWCVGVIKEANGDRRRKMDGEVINFFNPLRDRRRHVSACPDADVYGGEGTGSWVLLEPELE